MSLLRTLLIRREAGIAVMIVLFCLAVGLYKPQFLTLNSLRIILLLVPLILIGAMGQMLVLVELGQHHGREVLRRITRGVDTDCHHRQEGQHNGHHKRGNGTRAGRQVMELHGTTPGG